jgi:glycosyltransferase involved in cell wall biosynthesis
MLSAKSAMEGALAQAASVTLAVSGRDAGALEALGVRAVQILGHQLDAVPTNAPFSSRATFLFLGAIHGDENPNLDSLRYFCQEIWPTVRNATNAVLVIAGFGTEKFADEFSLPGIRLDGPQEDFRPLYESARVFVVPTRYCAGVPYKAHEAAAHGVPMVVTPIIRDQLGWTDGKECLVGADASEFAEKCIELFSNQTQWSALRNGALDRVSTELNTDAFGARIAEILGSLMATVDGVPADRLRELAAWE